MFWLPALPGEKSNQEETSRLHPAVFVSFPSLPPEQHRSFAIRHSLFLATYINIHKYKVRFSLQASSFGGEKTEALFCPVVVFKHRLSSLWAVWTLNIHTISGLCTFIMYSQRCVFSIKAKKNYLSHQPNLGVGRSQEYQDENSTCKLLMRSSQQRHCFSSPQFRLSCSPLWEYKSRFVGTNLPQSFIKDSNAAKCVHTCHKIHWVNKIWSYISQSSLFV